MKSLSYPVNPASGKLLPQLWKFVCWISFHLAENGHGPFFGHPLRDYDGDMGGGEARAHF